MPEHTPLPPSPTMPTTTLGYRSHPLFNEIVLECRRPPLSDEHLPPNPSFPNSGRPHLLRDLTQLLSPTGYPTGHPRSSDAAVTVEHCCSGEAPPHPPCQARCSHVTGAQTAGAIAPSHLLHHQSVHHRVRTVCGNCHGARATLLRVAGRRRPLWLLGQVGHEAPPAAQAHKAEGRGPNPGTVPGFGFSFLSI
jgi:hypothetical protein